MQPKYLLCDADLGEDEAAAVAEVVRGKWLSVGPRSAEFERRFAAYIGVRHAVCVNSCTAALHLALLAAGVGPGDEVLVPSYTFVASANAVLYCGATPVWVDITGPGDLNLDPEKLAGGVTPKTKAVVAVHLAGFPCDMDAVMRVAGGHGLKVVEDACHAIGATYASPEGDGSLLHGRKAGALGHAGCFSFFANKNLVTGEGGMLVTDDDDLAERARLGRSHGMTKTSYDKASGRASAYDIVQLGFNYRPTELTAAIGLVQLEKLDRHNATRRRMAARYRDRLAGVAGLTLPFLGRLDDSAHHIFPVLLDAPAAREPVREALLARGVQTSVHYPPVHTFTHYRPDAPAPGTLSRTEDAAARELTLPLHPLMTGADVDAICGLLVEAVAEAGQPA